MAGMAGRYILLLLALLSFAKLTFSEIVQNPELLMTFNVIQDQFPFNFKNIKSATIIEKNGRYLGLRIELKPYAIETFKRISTSGIGKVAILVFNNKIVSTATIQSAFGGDILLSGMKREDAQEMINKLKQNSLLTRRQDNNQFILR